MGKFILFVGGVIFIFYITIGVFFVAEISWIDTSFFVKDHFWLWSLLICGSLALLFFYASGKSYKDLKINESFFSQAMIENKISFQNNNSIPSKNKGGSHMSIIKKENEEITEFDLSKLTMESLVKKMAFEMTKPGPVFFKGWGNNRLRLDVERVQIIKNYIDSIRDTGESLMQLQSDAILSYSKIKALTEIKRTELKKQLHTSLKELNFIDKEFEHKIELMRLERENIAEDIKFKRAQREKIETENIVTHLKAEAEYKLIIAKSKKEKQIAYILAEAVKSYKDLPNVLKSYVAVQLGSDNSQNPSVDMELQDQLKDYVIRKHKAETEMLEYKADENKALTDTTKVKLEREKKKYLKNDNL